MKSLVLDSVSSPITKRVYNLGLDEFFTWFGQEPRPGFTKATAAAWRVALEARGLGAVSINVRITAVRKLAVEAADNGLLAPELANGITRVKGVASKGVRLGNWLTSKQAQALLNGMCCKQLRGLWYGEIVSRTRPVPFLGRHFADVIIILCVRWYLRYSLSYCDLEEIMAERGLAVDHVTIWRWVQHYAPLLNQRLRCELQRPNGSWRVDETYIKVAGKWAYLYRAVDSSGDTIDFLLSPKRDLTAAKLFLRLALSGTGGKRPRVINVDGHPAYARAIADLKQSGELGRRCRCRPSPYLNNIIEQDHRFIKKRIVASLGFRSAEGACRTIEGYEAMHLIRKGQVRWLPKGDVVGQRQFIHTLFGIAA